MSEVISLQHRVHDHEPDYAVTPTVRDIHNTLRVCQLQGFLGAVVGEPGTGKTMAIKAYASEDKRTKLCRMTRATSGLQPMLERICREVAGGVPAVSCSAARLLDLIIETVSRAEQSLAPINLLIIDEAQYLDDAALEGIRDLYDAIDGTCGIVLVGNDSLPARWSDTKKSKSSALFQQLRARMLTPLEVAAPDTEDLKALCAHHAITAKESCALIERAAARPGRLHNVDRFLRMSRQLAGDGMPTGQNFRDAAGFTGVSS